MNTWNCLWLCLLLTVPSPDFSSRTTLAPTPPATPTQCQVRRRPHPQATLSQAPTRSRKRLLGLGAVAVVCSVATGLTFIRLPPVWARPPGPPHRPPPPSAPDSIPQVQTGGAAKRPRASGISPGSRRHKRRIRRFDFHRFYVDMLRDL